MNLATFLQLSDLHFGHPGQATKRVASTPVVRNCVTGLFGHDFRPLKSIPDMLNPRSSNLALPEDTYLLFTGDLTRVGAESEFVMGRKYMSNKTEIDESLPIGLNAKDWSSRAVSGNHDHWPGTSIYSPGGLPGRGNNSSRKRAFVNAFGASFPPTVLGVPGSPYRIRFIRVDTDADTNWLLKLLGWGYFDSQLEALSSVLPTYEDTVQDGITEVRVLLLHHAMRTDGTFPLVLRIHPSSLRKLKAFIKRHRISVVLSGHIHEPNVARRSHDGWEYLDARCGTSAQGPPVSKRDTDRSSDEIARAMKSTSHTALVHTLVEREGRLEWRTTTYVHAPDVNPDPHSPNSTNRNRENRPVFIDYRRLRDAGDKPWSDKITISP